MIKAVLFDLGDTLIVEESIGGKHLLEAALEKVPYADEVLEILKGKYLVGIVTDTGISGEREVKEALRKVGIEHYFDAVVTSVDVGFQKPDQRIFEVALEALNVKPEEAVMVGNRVSRDILGANRVGTKTILFKWNERYDERIASAQEQPTEVIHSLKELPHVLLQLDR